MKLPDKTTPLGKGIRTFIQAFIPLLVIFSAILNAPAVFTIVSQWPFIIQVGGVSVIIGFASWLQNFLEKLLEE